MRSRTDCHNDTDYQQQQPNLSHYLRSATLINQHHNTLSHMMSITKSLTYKSFIIVFPNFLCLWWLGYPAFDPLIERFYEYSSHMLKPPKLKFLPFFYISCNLNLLSTTIIPNLRHTDYQAQYYKQQQKNLSH